MNDSVTPRRAMNLSAIRAELEPACGPNYWQSLEELASTTDLTDRLASAPPFLAPAADDPFGRRDFLRLMGASLALAGVTACTRQPAEKIVPYIDEPEAAVLGKPLYFATAVVQEGYAHGVLVESHEGRPTKIEGNPAHPESCGATSAQTQAAILTLYDPDRSRTVTHRGQPSSWREFLTALAPLLVTKRQHRGAGLRLLTGSMTSPTLAAQIRRLLALFPEAKWHQWEPLSHDHLRAGARLAFGRDLHTHYRLEAAEVIVCLDCDLLHDGPGAVRYAHDFAARRGAGGVAKSATRLYAVESTPSVTGSVADHRLSLTPGQIPVLAEALATALCGKTAHPFLRCVNSLDTRALRWVEVVARDLLERRHGRSVIAVGPGEPASVHALAHLMNETLGNTARTVIYTEPVETRAGDDVSSLGELCADIRNGAVDLLVIGEANPVYSAPADLEFAEALQRVAMRIRLGLYDDETSVLCHWHVPAVHTLESWGDARAFDGTVSLLQPLIAPLYGGRSTHELFAELLGEPAKSSYAAVRDYWRDRWGATFEARWNQALSDGVVANSAEPPLDVKVLDSPAQPLASAPTPAVGLQLVIRPDPSIRDGSFANNAWLQELAKPITKLTWENAACISPGLAERVELATGDWARLELEGRQVEAPVWILPGQAADTVTIHLGYGRARTGKVGTGMGFDAYAVRTSKSLWGGMGVKLTRTGGQTLLATTQSHHRMEGRALVRSATAREFEADPHLAQKWGSDPEPGLSLLPTLPQHGNAWGMNVDLSACIGCNACIIACQAENNIPVVGKEQVARGREMAWIRVDRYFEGPPDNPRIVSQPVMCMHCERAPCEPVCPVGATTHSAEGLNEMVYNRCVGTRSCSNNCPYKVRRFNFLQFTDRDIESLKAQRNPNVTVRTRGVTEKCTYCVQRINSARVAAKMENRSVSDSDIRTACEAACPSHAMTFGNVNDATSRVAALKASPLAYRLLGEIGTRPRTSYLAVIRNPNPEMEDL